MIRALRHFPIVLRTVVMAVAAVILLLALFAFLGSDALDDSTLQAQQMQLQSAGLAAQSLDVRLDASFQVLTHQADALGSGADPPADREETLSALAASGLFPGGTFLLDCAGSLLAAEPALDEQAAESLRKSPAVGRALETGARQTGDFDIDGGGSPRTVLLAPVPDSRGGDGCWLGGWIYLDTAPFRDFAGPAEAGGAYSMVVDSAGNTLELDSQGRLTVRPAANYAYLFPYLEKREAGLTRLDRNRIQAEESLIAAIVPMENAPWRMVIVSPESRVYGLLNTLRWQFVYFGALIMAAAIFFVWIYLEAFVGPIRELLQATRRLTDGDLSTPIRAAGRDETAELARAFDAMRLKMADWSGALSAAVERQTHRLSTLYAIDRAASKTLALEEVLTISLERVLDLLKMDAGAILLAEKGALRLKVQQALSQDLAAALSRVDTSHRGIGTATLRKKVSVAVPAEFPADGLLEQILRSGFQTVACTPLIAKDQSLGVLTLFTQAERTFAVDDLDLLESIGQQIGGAVHNAQLFESELHRREQAEGLYELGSEIISLSTQSDTARAICSKVSKAARAHSVNITLIDPNGQVVLRLTVDGRGTAASELPPRPHGLTMRVYFDGLPLIVEKPDPEQAEITRETAAAGVQAMIGLPLRASGRVVGTMFVRYSQPRSFSEEDIRGLTTFANTAAMALERVRLLQETERRLEEVAALYELSSVLRGAMTLHEMLPQLLHQALQIARADAASISLVDGQEVVCRAAEGLAAEVIDRRIPLGEGLTGGAAASGEIRQTPFLPRDPMLVFPPDSGTMVRGVGCTVCIPLRAADEVVGVLLLASSSRSQFGENELRLLKAAADIAGGSIHRANLFEQLEHRVHELSSLYEFGQAVSTSLHLEDVVRLIVRTVPPAVHAQAIWVFLWNEVEERLVLQHSGEGSDSGPAELKYRAGEGLVGWVFLEGRPAIVADVNSDPRWKQEAEHETATLGFRVRDVMAVPMIHGKKVLGVLLAINRQQQRRFSEADQSLCEALAAQTAIAIENAQLFEDVRAISVATISSLATAIDARDPYTRGHSEDVTKVVVQLARELGWHGADLEMLEFAALLHDVGKIAVPDDILRKPEKLVPDEWNVIYLHPYHSAQILRPVEPLRKIIPWIYHHHERWDGDGYPDRLKGEAIPEGARIIAVVDAFNAITTNRPYHKALSEKEALDEIERNSGKQFDPVVVRAFLRIMKPAR
ncbi:MAG: GAF domain-containing protein [Anaerolineales bacterium]|nr:GAF domain-containing protein [Anaerolineales bacterium]